MFFCFDAFADGDIFDSLSERASGFAVGLRNIAYVLSGFGLIMFTYLAICGKINFKHLGYITLSLFMVSAVGALIDYVTEGSEAKSQLESNVFGEAYKDAGKGELCHSSLCK
jgi:hypothetical protein